MEEKDLESLKAEILPQDKTKFDLSFKMIVLGDPGVGKSCLTTQAIKNIFNEAYNSTVGFEMAVGNKIIDESVLQLYNNAQISGGKYKNAKFENKREDVKQLKALMEEWGFYKHGMKTNGEAVLVKSMEVYDESHDPKYNYPLLKRNPSCFFLPIFPEYHTDLFPDMILKNENMHLYKENKAHRYALEKVYLSGARNVMAAPGDLVLIYRTGSRYPKKYSSVITGIAIIEEIIETNSVEECVSICKNRSIFEENEIRSQYYRRKTVIKLLDYLPFKTKVTLERLYEKGIVAQNSGPRQLDRISEEEFKIIYKMGMEDRQ